MSDVAVLGVVSLAFAIMCLVLVMWSAVREVRESRRWLADFRRRNP